MSTRSTTTDPTVIGQWTEEPEGRPTVVEGTEGKAGGGGG